MALLIQCILLCIIFTFLILPPQFKNPLSQITSYPPAIRERVASLPQYKDVLAVTKKKNDLNWSMKKMDNNNSAKLSTLSELEVKERIIKMTIELI